MARRATFRFAVGSPDGDRSGVWRLWTEPKGNDVYLAGRYLGGSFKVSLHGSGDWRVAFTEESPYRLPSGSRITDRWRRPPEMAPGLTRAFALWIPASEVRPSAAIKDPQAVYWAPTPRGEVAVEFNVFISAGRIEDGWPGSRSMGTKAPFRAEFDSGEWVWLVERRAPVSAEQRGQLEAARPNIAAALGQSERGRELLDGNVRAIMAGQDPDGLRHFTDLAVLPAPV